MSLREIIDGYVLNHDIILTSAPGEGTTTLALYLAMMLSENNFVIYYNPASNIDRHYVKTYYPKVFNDVLFIQSDLDVLLEFLDEIDYQFDYIIIDPGDVLMSFKKTILNLKKICNIKKSNMIFTSQIRLDPKLSWKPYSTIETINQNNEFDYSVWIRKATDNNLFFISKYIDVFKGNRIGNKYEGRYLVKFTKEGCMIT